MDESCQHKSRSPQKALITVQTDNWPQIRVEKKWLAIANDNKNRTERIVNQG